MGHARDRRAAWVVFFLVCLIAVGLGAAEPQPDVVVFYRDACNDCRHMDVILEEMARLYPELYIVRLEEAQPGASDLMWSLSSKYGVLPTKFPVIFVGDQVITGVGRDKELQLRAALRACVFDSCRSPLSRLERDPFPLTAVAIAAVVLATVLVLLLL